MVESIGKKVGLVLIDVQKGFLYGRWMRHFGQEEVTPIQNAYDRTVELVGRLSPDVPLIISRCPMGGEDGEPYPPFAQAMQGRQHKLVYKFQNDILEADGAYKWFSGLRARGVDAVVVGGCTTTSCVRVSAIQLQKHFGGTGLQVCVDLSLCGARSSNMIQRCSKCLQRYMEKIPPYVTNCGDCQFSQESYLSPLDMAVKDMRDAGVQVFDCLSLGL